MHHGLRPVQRTRLPLLPINGAQSLRAFALSLILLAERHNAIDRSDLEINVGKRHWVFKFKYAKEAAGAPKALEEAIEQIRTNHYGVSTSTKELIRVGVVYSDEQRQIAAWQEVA